MGLSFKSFHSGLSALGLVRTACFFDDPFINIFCLTMANFIKKLSLSEKRRQHFYNPWNLKTVIETYAGKPYDEVVKEQKEKREAKEK